MKTQDSTLPQSNSQIKRTARLKNQGQKSFGGKTKDFADNRERHFYQRMLKAYLRGSNTFQFGFDKETKKANWYDVQLTDKTVNPAELDKLLAGGYNDPGKVFGGVKPSKKALKKIISDRIEKEVAAMDAEIARRNKQPNILKRLFGAA